MNNSLNNQYTNKLVKEGAAISVRPSSTPSKYKKKKELPLCRCINDTPNQFFLYKLNKN